jgi:Fuc2NAc and GlcNAc transferase
MGLPLLAFLLSALLCGAYLRLARRWQIVDRPNERSSHQHPTPHGGGLALVLAFLAAASFYGSWPPHYLMLGGLTLLLAVLGTADDLWQLPANGRFFVYGLVSALVSGALLRGVIDLTSFGGGVLFALTAFAILWFMNLYNFMDGIDGIAATQAFIACAGIALLSWVYGGRPEYAMACLLLGMSHLGFLLWNWQPARLFMGDAGSVATGFLLAALALVGVRDGELPLACWLITLACFITDASVTLLWRMLTGQAFTQAHRLHAYQRLSRHWGSHRAVVLLLLALNALWLFPLAWAARVYPQAAPFLVILAYVPLLAGMAKARELA